MSDLSKKCVFEGAKKIIIYKGERYNHTGTNILKNGDIKSYWKSVNSRDTGCNAKLHSIGGFIVREIPCNKCDSCNSNTLDDDIIQTQFENDGLQILEDLSTVLTDTNNISLLNTYDNKMANTQTLDNLLKNIDSSQIVNIDILDINGYDQLNTSQETWITEILSQENPSQTEDI